jgi:hypothetical protein
MTDILLIMFAAAAVIIIAGKIAGAYVEKPKFLQVYMYITDELFKQTHPSTIEFRLITKFDLEPHEAQQCMENYAEGIGWFELHVGK